MAAQTATMRCSHIFVFCVWHELAFAPLACLRLFFLAVFSCASVLVIHPCIFFVSVSITSWFPRLFTSCHLFAFNLSVSLFVFDVPIASSFSTYHHSYHRWASQTHPRHPTFHICWQSSCLLLCSLSALKSVMLCLFVLLFVTYYSQRRTKKTGRLSFSMSLAVFLSLSLYRSYLLSVHQVVYGPSSLSFIFLPVILPCFCLRWFSRMNTGI